MLRSLSNLLRSDVERQTAWFKREASRQGQAIALTVAFAAVGAIAAIGTAAVGLIALYAWAEPRYGTMAALAILAAVLGGSALLFFAIAFLRGGKEAAPRPSLQVVDPSALQSALSNDVNAGAGQALAAVKRSSLGPAVALGEEAFKTGRTVYEVADKHLRGRSAASLLGTLGVVAVLGLVLGRRV